MRATPAVLAVAALTLSACEGGGDPVQMALRDAAAERQAAAVKDGTVSAPATAPAIQPASVDEGDAVYVAGMIEHHRAAMKMAVDALASSDDPEIRRMAQAEIETRTREITALQAWKPEAP